MSDMKLSKTFVASDPRRIAKFLKHLHNGTMYAWSEPILVRLTAFSVREIETVEHWAKLEGVKGARGDAGKWKSTSVVRVSEDELKGLLCGKCKIEDARKKEVHEEAKTTKGRRSAAKRKPKSESGGTGGSGGTGRKTNPKRKVAKRAKGKATGNRRKRK